MSITSRDHGVLEELTRRHLLGAPELNGYLSTSFDELLEWGMPRSFDAESLSDSIQILESLGFVQSTRALTKHPRTVRPTSAGVEHVIRSLVDGYDRTLERLADVVCDGAQHRSSTLATALGVPPKLVEHALLLWQSSDWVTLSQSIGEIHLLGAKAGLRRWRQQNDTESREPEAETTPVLQAKRARRVWGGRWEATSEQPAATRGQGSVWKVRDLRDTQLRQERPLYALKELRHPKPTEATAFKRFKREVEAMKTLALSTSGIISVVDAHLPEDGGKHQPYYIMPWAAQSLDRAKFLSGASSLEKVLEIGIALAETLSTCHEASPRVVHRDVKPANVLLDGPELTPKLADFGICFLEDPERLTSTEANTVGSAGFTAPELEGGGTVESVGPAADVYSLGKTLYAVLAGGEVFPRESHTEDRFNLALRFADQRLAHFHGLLERMVATKPEDRYESMARCREQLQRVVANIRSGLAYQPGMYGDGESAQERFASLQRTLIQPPDARRKDGIVLALERAEEASNAVAKTFAGQHPTLRTPAGQPFAEGLPHAAHIADHFLAVGLPLIMHEETDFFEEWLDRVSKFAERDAYSAAPERMVLVAGAVLAIHGAASVAWERRRTGILGLMVRRSTEAGGDWIHLTLLGQSAGQLLRWVATWLPRSMLLKGALAVTAERVAAISSVLAALSAWHRLIAASPDEKVRLTAFRFDELDLPAFPICYADNVDWASAVALAFRQSRQLERAVARDVFALEATVLRSEAARLTPAFLNRAAELRREKGRDGFFGLGAEWNTWAGLTPGR